MIKNSLTLNKLHLVMINEPKKMAAIGIFIVTGALFISQLFYVIKDEDSKSISTQRTLVKKNPASVDEHSLLFSTPLFGNYVANPSDMDIKQSTLDVEVVGILYAGKEQGSQVVIRVTGGEERIFSIGDSLPGEAVIKTIEKNEVVVLYHGSFERLNLPQNKLLFDEPAKPLIQE
jgi:general secretion pathway protein C